jgi:DNA topoisomerase-1
VVTAAVKPAKASTNGHGGDAAALDAVASAKLAKLRYVSDASPGIRRERLGDSFRYLAPNSNEIDDDAELARIRKLAIPPAWTDVWICPHANGHLQATGRDARGRKQYRYHPRWREVRDEAKYGRMVSFGELLPRMRRRIDADLALPGLPREKVLAAVVRLLEATLIRVGNEEYARSNESYGLTTMRNDHVDINGSQVTFEFRGKSGKDHAVGVRDLRLARVIKQCRELPGQELFQYVSDDGQRQTIDSGDVNEYLREVTGEEFTAKDFRTWAGTVLAAATLSTLGPGENAAETKKSLARTFELVAQRLGNTPAISRKCYVHPVVVESYLMGKTVNASTPDDPEELGALHELAGFERAVLKFLREQA